MTGHQVKPGLWCSYPDDKVLQAASQKLETGEARLSDFGAFVGMVALEPDRLRHYMIQRHWFVARPSGGRAWETPPQGWGGFVYDKDGQWIDDREWQPWRAVLQGLGGEFADWAQIDWLATCGKQSDQFARESC
jgi:hypothetical protein